jgi:hypothetical protein
VWLAVLYGSSPTTARYADNEDPAGCSCLLTCPLADTGAPQPCEPPGAAAAPPDAGKPPFLEPTDSVCDKPLTLPHRHHLQTLERKIYRQPGAQVPSVQELTDRIRFLYGLTTEDDAQIMRYVIKDHFKKQVRPCRVSVS